MPLFTGCCLQEFRRLELVGRTARRRRRQILGRLMRHPLVEALDDHGVARRSLELREPDHDTKANKQHEHEYRARCQALEGADDELLNLGGAHAPSPLFDFWGTSYITSPRRTSSIARRSAFFGNGPSSERMRRR